MRNSVALQGVVVPNHHAERGGRGRRKGKESGHPRLDEIMRSATIHEDDELLMVNRAKQSKGMRGESAFHGIKADLGDNRRRRRWRNRRFKVIGLVVCDEQM